MKNIFILLFSFTTIFGSSQIDLTSGLKAYYPFKTNANDASGNGNNASVFGATLTSDKNQLPNNAYSFTNVSDRVAVPYNSGLDISGTKQFSAAVWIYPTATPLISARLINFGSIYAKSYELIYTSSQTGVDSGRIEFNNYNSSTVISIISNTKIILNTWSLIIVTVDANSGITRLFLNNSLVGTSSIPPIIPTSPTFSSTPMVTIGNHATFDWGLKGKIDEVRIYNRILNASEINYLYDHYSAIHSNTTLIATKIFPNPFTTKLEILTPWEHIVTVELIDVFGRVLCKESFSKTTEIDLNSLLPGSYFLRVTSVAGIEISKVEKI